jgi:hypothetical protein
MLVIVRRKITKTLIWEKLPCVRRLRPYYTGQVVRGAMLLSRDNKNDKEAKKQGKRFHPYSHERNLKYAGLQIRYPKS